MQDLRTRERRRNNQHQENNTSQLLSIMEKPSPDKLQTGDFTNINLPPTTQQAEAIHLGGGHWAGGNLGNGTTCCGSNVATGQHDSEASKGGMKAGRIKDPLYKDYYLGISHLPSPHLLRPPNDRNKLHWSPRRFLGLCRVQVYTHRLLSSSFLGVGF